MGIGQSLFPDVRRCRLPGELADLDVERNLLAFDEAPHASLFQSGHVNEDILSAVIGLNESITPSAVVEFNGACRHRTDFLVVATPKSAASKIICDIFTGTQEAIMAKGQKRSSREPKKPKTDKPKPAATSLKEKPSGASAAKK